MSGEEVFNEVLDTTIDRARNGDTESARKILEWFCGAIKANTDKNGRPYRKSSGIGTQIDERKRILRYVGEWNGRPKPSGIGTQIDERILRYVGECFKRILDGGPSARVDANHALGIVAAGKKGNKKTQARRERELLTGLQVRNCHGRIKAERKISKGQRLRGELPPLEEAIKEVARKHHKSFDTVKNSYDEWNKTYRLLDLQKELQKMGK